MPHPGGPTVKRRTRRLYASDVAAIGRLRTALAMDRVSDPAKVALARRAADALIDAVSDLAAALPEEKEEPAA